VLELAGLLLDLVFVLYLQGLGEESLSKTVTTNYIGGALLACRREVDDEVSVLL